MTLNLLVVEPDLDVQAQLQQALDSNYELTTVQLPHEASTVIEKSYPHLFLITLSPFVMPFIKLLKSHPLKEWSPIILMAMPEQLQDPQYKELLKTHDYILKPIVPHDVLFRLNKHLEGPVCDGILLTDDDELKEQCMMGLSGLSMDMITVADFSVFSVLAPRTTASFYIMDHRLVQGHHEELQTILDQFQGVRPSIMLISEAQLNLHSQSELMRLADDYILKPVNTVDLRLRLKRLTTPLQQQALLIQFKDHDTASIAHWLRNSGFDLTIRANSEHALHNLEHTEYDLILWDLEGQTEESLDLFYEVKKFHAETPLLFLCSADDLEEKSNFLVKGSDYVVKPLSEEKILLRLQRLMNKPQKPSDTVIEPLTELATAIEPDIDAAIATAPIPMQTLDNPDIQLSSTETPLSAAERANFLDQIRVGLNHEIRNPLTSILIGAQALSQHLENQPDERDIVLEIEKAAKRIRHILNAMGNMQKYIVEDYVGDIKMLSFVEKADD